MANYWEAQTSGFNRGIGNLGNALIQIPRLRALQQYRQQMAETAAAREQAYADEARAHADVYRGQKAGMDADQMGDSKLADALNRYAKNPQDTDAQADVISGFGRAYKKYPEATAKSLGDLFAQFAARNGSTNVTQMGELQGGATSIANNQANLAAKAKAPVILKSGDTAMSPDLGTVLAQAATTLAPGAARTSPVTGDDTPDIEVTNPGAPKSSALQEILARKVAEVVADPKLDAKTKNATISALKSQVGAVAPSGASGLGAALTQGASSPPSNAPAAAPTATAGQKVRVQHPNGTFGFIPSEQVQDALSQGYKLAQ